MGFISNRLASEEKVVYRARLHWLVYSWGVVLALAAAVIYAANLPELGNVFVFLAVLKATASFLTVATGELAVTNKRVLGRMGFIRRQFIDLPLPQIEHLSVDQGFFGRRFGAGTIVVLGSDGTKKRFSNIAAPLGIYDRVPMHSGRPVARPSF